ncbi:glycosyltransferase family 2 protein, partial [uncultured Demequina sp.]|uniref:glycosyltransferase n=1 Tax=uncultured Demequina sp. TaxID=693499 RepID=UPI0025E2A23F
MTTLQPLPDLPPVSVVMPVRNEAEHLEDAVRATLDSGYGGELEVVLAVGPSDDDTVQIAHRLADDPQ